MSRPLEVGWKHFPLKYYLCGNPARALISYPQGIMGKVISPFWRLSHIPCFKSLWHTIHAEKRRRCPEALDLLEIEMFWCSEPLPNFPASHPQLSPSPGRTFLNSDQRFPAIPGVGERSHGGFSCFKKEILNFSLLVLPLLGQYLSPGLVPLEHWQRRGYHLPSVTPFC